MIALEQCYLVKL